MTTLSFLVEWSLFVICGLFLSLIVGIHHHFKRPSVPIEPEEFELEENLQFDAGSLRHQTVMELIVSLFSHHPPESSECNR